MSVKIRLSRGGTKKRPYYYIVVAELGLAARRALHRADRHAQSAAAQGQRRPRQARRRARQALAVSVGAQPTDRVARFLDAAGLAKREASNNPSKAKPKKKRLEREAAAAEAAAKKAEGGARRRRAPPSGVMSRRPFGQKRRVFFSAASPGAHGIRGEVLIHAFTAAPENIAAYGPLSDAAGARAFEIESARVTAKGVVARLEGVADRNAAEALKGVELYVDRDRLPAAAEGEFYHADLIGLAAVDPQGKTHRRDRGRAELRRRRPAGDPPRRLGQDRAHPVHRGQGSRGRYRGRACGRSHAVH